jgi:hypothetical protein
MPQFATLLLADLRGGENDEHPATIAENQVARAVNVDYYTTFLLARRNGSTVLLSGAPADYYSLGVYTPNSVATNDELWALDSAGNWFSYSNVLAQTAYTPNPADAFTPASPVSFASLHGKLFLANPTTSGGATPLNRIHVWDGTTLRRAGLAGPDLPPSVADQGAGSFSSTRYYRVRWTVQNGSGTTLLRSEPSPQVTFVPNGTSASARITRPAVNDENPTNWEVEESINNADWYRIATVAIGTTTYDDSLAKTAVATSGVLSADIGDYLPMGSVRYLAVDRDRLIGFGNYYDPSQDSNVVWTPVGTDPAGVGNDERLPFDVGSVVALDGQDGGPLTGGNSYDARIVAFKMHRTYTLTHTGIRQSAYLPQPVSRTYGALPLSNVEGVDAEGRPTLFFVDDKVGPMALGANGFEVLSPFLQERFLSTTEGINLSASFRVTHAVYHADRKQVWWFFAGIGENTPSFIWVYNVSTDAVAFYTMPQVAYHSVMWNRKPVYAVPSGTVITGDTLGATDDYGHPFRAYITTRAYQLGGLIKRFHIKAAMIEGDAASGVTLAFTRIRDYGLESLTTLFSLTPQGSERYVIASMDDAMMQEATTLQLEIGDPSGVSVTPWLLTRCALKWDTASDNV